MPGADATVDVKVLGKPLNFVGHGYHDKVCQAESLYRYFWLFIEILTIEMLTTS
jgi:hypothetical protein